MWLVRASQIHFWHKCPSRARLSLAVTFGNWSSRGSQRRNECCSGALMRWPKRRLVMRCCSLRRWTHFATRRIGRSGLIVSLTPTRLQSLKRLSLSLSRTLNLAQHPMHWTWRGRLTSNRLSRLHLWLLSCGHDKNTFLLTRTMQVRWNCCKFRRLKLLMMIYMLTSWVSTNDLTQLLHSLIMTLRR